MEKICVSRRTLGELTTAAWRAIAKYTQTHPDAGGQIYRRGVEVVRILPPTSGGSLPSIQTLNVDRLRWLADKAAFWYRAGKGKADTRADMKPALDAPTIEESTTSSTTNPDMKPAKITIPPPPVDSPAFSYDPVPPPLDVIRNLLADPAPPIPRLDGIITVPTVSATGHLQTLPGYDPRTRLYLHPLHNLRVPPVPETPTAAELLAARELILSDLIIDFPFENQGVDEGYILCMLLQPFVRPLIHSCTPFYLIDKPQAGTGATFLANSIISIVTGGNPAARASLDISASNDAENAKKLLSVFAQSPAVVFLDNIEGALTSRRLTETITTDYISDRLLGGNAIGSYPVRCLWIGTGNNPKMSADMVRRTIRIRLNAKMARPETRTGFKHPDLELWVSHNLPKLIHACLTIIQHWIACGQPLDKVRKGGGFEHWSQVMGGILALLELDAEFLSNAATMHESLDEHETDWMILIEAWWERHQNRGITTTQVYEIWDSIESEIALGHGSSERANTTKLGILLKDRRDRHFGPYRIAGAGMAHNKKLWKLERWESVV